MIESCLLPANQGNHLPNSGVSIAGVLKIRKMMYDGKNAIVFVLYLLIVMCLIYTFSNYIFDGNHFHLIHEKNNSNPGPAAVFADSKS
ncbi:hypothetical protein GGD38_006246 [Chitinophagaceae bacterium OAS944]|nr:hypothetical protein [Chitinophagaceae bacterium OAS944]